MKVIAKQSDVNVVGIYKWGVLHWCVALANIEMMNFWIGFDGCNVNLQSIWGETPLHLCVDIKRLIPEETTLAMITILMKMGADVTIRSKSGNSPLMSGRYKNHINALMFEPYELTMSFLCSLNDARKEVEEYEDMEMLGYEYDRRETFALSGLLNVDAVDMMCYHILKYVI